MEKGWFCVGYKIDNGSKTETWDMYVLAPTISMAKKMTLEECKKYNPKAKVTIVDARKVSEEEMYNAVN